MMSPASAAALPASWHEDREQIVHRYLQLLAEARSPLLAAGAPVRKQLTAQLYAVIDTVMRTVDPAAVSTATGAATPPGLSETIGRSRATAGIHPSQSLQAASLIFEAALPTIASRVAATGDPDPELTAGVLLNREILTRMALAARAYVDHLLATVHSANRDERRRVSRELHDVAAPAVAIGLQNLELFDLYAPRDPERAASKVDAARQALLDALATIRNLSAESRENVAAKGLAEATRRFTDTLPSTIRVDLTTRGSLELIPLPYAEELFLIIREAIRNAARHANPRTVTTVISLANEEVRASVSDDGTGFNLGKVLAGERHVGLDSMHERAELLGAGLDIASSPRAGTTVTVTISLPNRPLASSEAAR
jgi:signal transduction histidine kinase